MTLEILKPFSRSLTQILVHVLHCRVRKQRGIWPPRHPPEAHRQRPGSSQQQFPGISVCPAEDLGPRAQQTAFWQRSSTLKGGAVQGPPQQSEPYLQPAKAPAECASLARLIVLCMLSAAHTSARPARVDVIYRYLSSGTSYPKNGSGLHNNDDARHVGILNEFEIIGADNGLCVLLQDCQCCGGRPALGTLSTSSSCLMLQQAARSWQSKARAWWVRPAGRTDTIKACWQQSS